MNRMFRTALASLIAALSGAAVLCSLLTLSWLALLFLSAVDRRGIPTAHDATELIRVFVSWLLVLTLGVLGIRLGLRLAHPRSR